MPYKDRAKHREMVNRAAARRAAIWKAAKSDGQLLSASRYCVRCETEKPLVCFNPTAKHCKTCHELWVEAKRNAGQCVIHGQPVTPGYKTCPLCRALDEKKRKRLLEARPTPECRQCQKPIPNAVDRRRKLCNECGDK